jgi:asparagine synthase (glutamine-hydrolysing)
MCGIGGIVAIEKGGVDRAELEAMTRVVAHRGPDGDGVWTEGRVGLGHRRLAIIDPTAAGAQPMSRDGTLTIVFNGEIYNYIELREELRGLRQNFETRTDTEVILAAYAVWGDECVKRFNGMWSFVIHDRAHQRLFCSRDRFGVKPFYYAKTRSAWIFGSEIRQLLPLLASVRARRDAVTNFLFASISEQPNGTFYEDIEKLPAGHNLVYDLRANTVYLNRYYRLGPREFANDSPSPSTSIERYGSLLENAVELRLRSDVPVGTCLSGGLDSSTVTALAAPLYQRASRRPFCAITACSEDPAKDESRYAQLVAERLNLEWFTVRPTYTDFAETLDNVVLAQEEPFPRASMCMQYFVMRCARQNGIPVLLDGQGGDETLLGYERYFAAYLLDLLIRRSPIAAMRAAKASRTNNARMALLTLLQYFVFFNFPRVRYWTYRRRAPYLKQHPPMPPVFDQYARVSADLTALQRLELEHTNLPALLRYEDKNSMWHSVESRLPFLDYRVVEMALSLASDVKIAEGWTKYPLRRYMDGRMPAEIAWRRDKIGFEAPDAIWLREHHTAMRHAVSGSKLLQDLCHSRFLNGEYSSLDANTQWRLFSVAKWESTFNVQ